MNNLRAAVVALGVALSVCACERPPARVSPAAAGRCPARDSVQRAWDSYLAARRNRLHSEAGQPVEHWSAREQSQWPMFDMAMFYLLDGGSLRLTDIDCSDSAHYRITARFIEPPQTTQRSWYTALTVTVDAERESGRWVLVSALARNTRDWQRESVGTITYVMDPTLQFNRTRAERGMGFADSISRAFGVPRLAPITYYVVSSLDRVYEIIGLTSEQRLGPGGGLAQPVNRLLFSGIPSIGEDYRHELAHLVLAPLFVSGRTLAFVSEAVPTWLGGTSGMTFRDAASQLSRFLSARPAMTLDSLMTGSPHTIERYTAGAVLVDLVHREGGIAAVKRLFAAGPTDRELRSSIEQLLQRPWPDIARDWRRHVVSTGQ